MKHILLWQTSHMDAVTYKQNHANYKLPRVRRRSQMNGVMFVEGFKSESVGCGRLRRWGTAPRLVFQSLRESVRTETAFVHVELLSVPVGVRRERDSESLTGPTPSEPETWLVQEFHRSGEWTFLPCHVLSIFHSFHVEKHLAWAHLHLYFWSAESGSGGSLLLWAASVLPRAPFPSTQVCHFTNTLENQTRRIYMFYKNIYAAENTVSGGGCPINERLVLLSRIFLMNLSNRFAIPI